jgi:membrane associated rhomboid family serine protease
MRNDPGREIQRFFLGGGMPVTMCLLAANVVTFLVSFFLMRSGPGGPFSWLVFNSDRWPDVPWTILTWPLVAPLDLIGLLFGGLWMFWVGGSLERSWGWRTFLGFLAATAALSALTLWGASRIFQVPVLVQGLWLASAPATVAWCVLNRREVIRLYAIIPIPAPVLMWLTMAITWFQYSMGARNPIFGLFALSGCAAAYWYVTGGKYSLSRMGTSSGDRPQRMGGYGPRDRESVERDTGGFNPLRWWRERQQRKRLEAMFRRSGFDDDERKRR